MLSERKWSPEAVVRLLLGVFVTFAIAQLLLGAMNNLALGDTSHNKGLIDLMIATFCNQGAWIFLIVLFLREQKLSWNDAFGFAASPKAKAILIGVGTGLVVVPLALGLQHVSAQIMDSFSLRPESQELVRKFQESAKSAPSSAMIRQHIFFGISVILIAPVAEEMLFRGVLYPTLKQLGYPRLALWGTSLIFAALHSNLPSLLPFVFLAIVLVKVYEATDNLLASIATHSFFNAANFVFMLYEEPINRFLKHLT